VVISNALDFGSSSIKIGIILYLSLLLYSNYIMSLFIMFLVCSSSIFDIVMIVNEFMYKFAKRLALDSRKLSGRSYVGVMLRYYLPTNISYWPGRVVVHDGDSFVDSYIVHHPLIGQAEFVLRSKSCYVLIYFSNVPYT